MAPGLLSYEGGAYPCLSLKAYNGRLFLMFFEVVLRTVLRRGGLGESREEVQLASAAVSALVAFFDRMEAAGRYLSANEASGLYEACVQFLNLLQVLALVSLRRSIPRWKIVPKHHMMMHLATGMKVTRYNCRAFHCFIDEDFIGRWKSLSEMVPKELMEFRLLTRYLLRLKALH